MGFMDKVKDMLGQHSEKVGQGVDKGAEAVDRKTGGKYTDKIQTGTDKAKERIEGMSDEKREGGGGKGTAA